MRWHTITLVILAIAAQVSALLTAAPWQIVTFFYAYRISIDAFGMDGNQIAPGCVGSNADKSCNFDEFARYIQKKTARGTAYPAVLIGDNLEPDPYLAVEAMEKSGWVTTRNALTNAYVLVPEAYPNPKETQPGLSETVEAINGYVTKARDYMTGTLGLTQDFINGLPNFVNLKIGIYGIVDARREDFSKKSLHVLANILKNGENPITVVYKDLITWDNVLYQELDTAATILANPGMDAKTIVDSAVSKMYIQNVGRPKEHAELLDSFDKWLSDLSLPVGCTT